jgi:hypothetical protein
MLHIWLRDRYIQKYSGDLKLRVGVLFGVSIRLSRCPANSYTVLAIYVYIQLEPRPFSAHCSGPIQHTQYDELSSHPERKREEGGGGEGEAA